MQSIEILKEILQIGNSLNNYLIIFDALASEMRKVKLKKDPNCMLCGKNPTILNIKKQKRLQMTKSLKKCLTVIMFTYDKEKLNYGLSIICAAAAINRPTEILFAGENIYNLLDGKHLKKINRKKFTYFF